MRARRTNCARLAALALLPTLFIVAIFAMGSRGAWAELPQELRIVTYNIHHGEGLDRKFDLPRIAKRLLDADPDIVALQEVDQGTRRASGVDQPAELARLTGMGIVFGKNIDYEGGGYGTAVLTNLPVRSQKSVKLKSFYAPTATNPEQRGVQVLELGGGDGPPLLFLCTHLDYRPSDAERMASAKTINGLVQQRDDQLAILAGDLNATPDSREMAEFAKHWKVAGGVNSDTQPLAAASGSNGFTFPADKPNRRIDYILCRPTDRWEVVEVRVLDEPVASDHRPLLAVLRRLR